MGYKVIHFFTDLQDNNHPYKVGDSFPRLGKDVSANRINELATDKNKQKKPLIAYVEEVKKVEKEESATASQFTKTEINRMPINELKALASANGIDGWVDMTGAELKKMLIEKFNL
jgi:hypothetical protein